MSLCIWLDPQIVKLFEWSTVRTGQGKPYMRNRRRQSHCPEVSRGNHRRSPLFWRVAAVVRPPQRRLPGRTAPAGAGSCGGGKSGPGAGIHGDSTLCHICSRFCCVAITRSKRRWSVVSPSAGHPGPVLSPASADLLHCRGQHERNRRVAPLEAGSASTCLAASVPFLFVFSRKFAASYIVFCSPRPSVLSDLPEQGDCNSEAVKETVKASTNRRARKWRVT